MSDKSQLSDFFPDFDPSRLSFSVFLFFSHCKKDGTVVFDDPDRVRKRRQRENRKKGMPDLMADLEDRRLVAEILKGTDLEVQCLEDLPDDWTERDLLVKRSMTMNQKEEAEKQTAR